MPDGFRNKPKLTRNQLAQTAHKEIANIKRDANQIAVEAAKHARFAYILNIGTELTIKSFFGREIPKDLLKLCLQEMYDCVEENDTDNAEQRIAQIVSDYQTASNEGEGNQHG